MVSDRLEIYLHDNFKLAFTGFMRCPFKSKIRLKMFCDMFHSRRRDIPGRRRDIVPVRDNRREARFVRQVKGGQLGSCTIHDAVEDACLCVDSCYSPPRVCWE